MATGTSEYGIPARAIGVRVLTDVASQSKKTSGRGRETPSKVLPDLPTSSKAAKSALENRGMNMLTEGEKETLTRELQQLAKKRRDAEANSANLKFSG